VGDFYGPNERATPWSGQDPVPALIGDVQEGDEIRDTGDLDRSIQMAEPLARELHRLPDVVTAADVADDRLHRGAARANPLRGGGEDVGFVVQNHNRGAFGREGLCDRPSDALCGARDDDAFAREPGRGPAHAIKPPWPGPRGMTGQMSTMLSPSTTW
jgi:hypothetical protein